MSRTKTVGRQEINAEKKRSQLLEIWRRLKKNKVAVVGLVILGVLLCVAIFADVIVDYDLGIRQNMAIKLQSHRRSIGLVQTLMAEICLPELSTAAEFR